MRMLKARVYERERSAHRTPSARPSARARSGAGDRIERIRTYNWPQNRVTDHRLNQNFSLEQVLDGKLDPLLDALVAQDREERIRNLA